MPIYEFTCKECGKISEHLIFPGDDESELRCRNCGSNTLKRILSSFVGRGGESGSLNPCAGCQVTTCSPSCKSAKSG